jgi:hypothetical protein
MADQEYAKPIQGYRVPLRSESLATIQANRPSLAEVATLSTNRPVKATRTKAHLADLTEPQLRVLWAADNPSGLVSQNGSTGVTRPIIKALDAKGYGTAAYDQRRRHLVIGFTINDRGRRAARERFGVPEWAVSVHNHRPPSIHGPELCGRIVIRPNGTDEQCAEPVRSPIHDPAAYLTYCAKLATELVKWVKREGEYAILADDEHVHPFTD